MTDNSCLGELRLKLNVPGKNCFLHQLGYLVFADSLNMEMSTARCLDVLTLQKHVFKNVIPIMQLSSGLKPLQCN